MEKDLGNKGLGILAFPCNQFGGQEPGTPMDIQAFAIGKMGAQFFISEKIDVNGPNTHEIYNYLRTNS